MIKPEVLTYFLKRFVAEVADRKRIVKPLSENKRRNLLLMREQYTSEIKRIANNLHTVSRKEIVAEFILKV